MWSLIMSSSGGTSISFYIIAYHIIIWHSIRVSLLCMIFEVVIKHVEITNYERQEGLQNIVGCQCFLYVSSSYVVMYFEFLFLLYYILVFVLFLILLLYCLCLNICLIYLSLSLYIYIYINLLHFSLFVFLESTLRMSSSGGTILRTWSARRGRCAYTVVGYMKHWYRCWLWFESSDPAPLISKLTQIYPAAANTNECLFIRPLALTCAMSVKIDIRGEGVRPTLKTSRTSIYLSDTGIILFTTVTFNVRFHHIILYHIMLYYTILHYTISYHIILSSTKDDGR